MVKNPEPVDLTFLQTIRVMNRIYKVALVLVVFTGIILFIRGRERIGFSLTILAVFDFGRRYGFDKGFLIGLDRGYQKGLGKRTATQVDRSDPGMERTG